MRGIWIRRLIPASIVGIVLGFSYFAPALGVDVAPVNSHNQDMNCGRFGYGYHGGKHNFVCPTHPPAANSDATPVNTQASAVKSQAPATLNGSSTTNQPPAPVAAPATKSVVGVPVSVGVSQWRGFTELVLRQLS
jgi:hypothetical protein